MNIIVSPHLDDAVLSCFGVIKNSLVVTIFAGYHDLNDWDRKCGITDNKVRHREDIKVLKSLGANYRHDSYQEGGSFSLDIEGDNIYFPMGIKHPDHIRLRERFVQLLKEGKFSGSSVHFYEDFPYLVDAEEYDKALNALKKDFKLEKHVLRCNLKDKVLAIAGYESQVGAIFGGFNQIKKSLLSRKGRIIGKLNYYFNPSPKVSERYWEII